MNNNEAVMLSEYLAKNQDLFLAFSPQHDCDIVDKAKLTELLKNYRKK